MDGTNFVAKMEHYQLFEKWLQVCCCSRQQQSMTYNTTTNDNGINGLVGTTTSTSTSSLTLIIRKDACHTFEQFCTTTTNNDNSSSSSGSCCNLNEKLALLLQTLGPAFCSSSYNNNNNNNPTYSCPTNEKQYNSSLRSRYLALSYLCGALEGIGNCIRRTKNNKDQVMKKNQSSSSSSIQNNKNHPNDSIQFHSVTVPVVQLIGNFLLQHCSPISFDDDDCMIMDNINNTNTNSTSNTNDDYDDNLGLDEKIRDIAMEALTYLIQCLEENSFQFTTIQTILPNTKILGTENKNNNNKNNSYNNNKNNNNKTDIPTTTIGYHPSQINNNTNNNNNSFDQINNNNINTAIKLCLQLARNGVERRCSYCSNNPNSIITAADGFPGQSYNDDNDDDEYLDNTNHHRIGLSLLPRSKRSLCFTLLLSATTTVGTILRIVESKQQQQQSCDNNDNNNDYNNDNNNNDNTNVLVSFALFVTTCLQGESDPRCLLQLLQLFQFVLQSFLPYFRKSSVPSLSSSSLSYFPVSAFFDAVAPYYPIQFTPPPGNPHGITKQQLRNALLSVMCYTEYDDPTDTTTVATMTHHTVRAIVQAMLTSPTEEDDDTPITLQEQYEALEDLNTFLFGSLPAGSPLSSKVTLLSATEVTRVSDALIVVHENASRAVGTNATAKITTAITPKQLGSLCRVTVARIALEIERESVISFQSQSSINQKPHSSLWDAFVRIPIQTMAASMEQNSPSEARIAIAYVANMCASGGIRTTRCCLSSGLRPLIRYLSTRKSFEPNANDMVDDDDICTTLYALGAFFTSAQTTIEKCFRDDGIWIHPHPLQPYHDEVVETVTNVLVRHSHPTTSAQEQQQQQGTAIRIAAMRALECIIEATSFAPSATFSYSMPWTETQIQKVHSLLQTIYDAFSVVIGDQQQQCSMDIDDSNNDYCSGNDNDSSHHETEWLSCSASALGRFLGMAIVTRELMQTRGNIAPNNKNNHDDSNDGSRRSNAADSSTTIATTNLTPAIIGSTNDDDDDQLLLFSKKSPLQDFFFQTVLHQAIVVCTTSHLQQCTQKQLLFHRSILSQACCYHRDAASTIIVLLTKTLLLALVNEKDNLTNNNNNCPNLSSSSSTSSIACAETLAYLFHDPKSFAPMAFRKMQSPGPTVFGIIDAILPASPSLASNEGVGKQSACTISSASTSTPNQFTQQPSVMLDDSIVLKLQLPLNDEQIKHRAAVLAQGHEIMAYLRAAYDQCDETNNTSDGMENESENDNHQYLIQFVHFVANCLPPLSDSDLAKVCYALPILSLLLLLSPPHHGAGSTITTGQTSTMFQLKETMKSLNMDLADLAMNCEHGPSRTYAAQCLHASIAHYSYSNASLSSCTSSDSGPRGVTNESCPARVVIADCVLPSLEAAFSTAITTLQQSEGSNHGNNQNSSTNMSLHQQQQQQQKKKKLYERNMDTIADRFMLLAVLGSAAALAYGAPSASVSNETADQVTCFLLNLACTKRSVRPESAKQVSHDVNTVIYCDLNKLDDVMQQHSLNQLPPPSLTLSVSAARAFGWMLLALSAEEKQRQRGQNSSTHSLRLQRMCHVSLKHIISLLMHSIRANNKSESDMLPSFSSESTGTVPLGAIAAVCYIVTAGGITPQKVQQPHTKSSRPSPSKDLDWVVDIILSGLSTMSLRESAALDDDSSVGTNYDNMHNQSNNHLTRLVLASLLQLLCTTPTIFENKLFYVVTGVMRAFALAGATSTTVQKCDTPKTSTTTTTTLHSSLSSSSSSLLVCKLLCLQILDVVAQLVHQKHPPIETTILFKMKPAVLSILSVAMNHPSTLIRRAGVEVRNNWCLLQST